MTDLPLTVTIEDAKNPSLLVRLLRTISDKLAQLGARIDSLPQNTNKPPTFSQIRDQLSVTGSAPLNVLGLRGVLSDPQPAATLRYSTIPTGQVLQSLKDTQLITVVNGAGYDLYTVIGGNPNTLFKLFGGAGGGTMMTTDTAQTVTGVKTFTAPFIIASPFGATMAPVIMEEEITLNTGGATTDSSANLLLANCRIEAVVARVTVGLTGPTTSLSLGDSSFATRFIDSMSPVTINSTSSGQGLEQWQGSVSISSAGPVQLSAAKVRITANGGTPSAGKVRVTVFGLQFGAATS